MSFTNNPELYEEYKQSEDYDWKCGVPAVVYALWLENQVSKLRDEIADLKKELHHWEEFGEI